MCARGVAGVRHVLQRCPGMPPPHPVHVPVQCAMTRRVRSWKSVHPDTSPDKSEQVFGIRSRSKARRCSKQSAAGGTCRQRQLRRGRGSSIHHGIPRPVSRHQWHCTPKAMLPFPLSVPRAYSVLCFAPRCPLDSHFTTPFRMLAHLRRVIYINFSGPATTTTVLNRNIAQH